MRKFGICGSFDFKTLDHGGQPVKTRQLYYELCKKYKKEDILVLEMFKTNKLLVLFKSICMMFSCKHVILLPAQSGVQTLLPLCVFLNFLFRKKLSYVVIGGWIASLARQKKWLQFFLKRLHGIYVETAFMKRELEELGISCVEVLPNPKDIVPIPEEEIKVCSKPIKLCTFARITEKKGIEDAIRAVREVNQDGIQVTLDIYGLIENSYQERFSELQKDFPEYICYGGAIPFEEAVSVLKNYDLQLFPTKFPTEGIPGSIVDGYFAGLPVLSSKWESFADVVEDGVTGIGFEFENYHDFVNKLSELIKNPEQIYRMKQNCLMYAKDYLAVCQEKISSYF